VGPLPTGADPRLSRRAEDVPASPIRKLVPYADRAKREGKKIYHLNIGQPDLETPAAFWEAVTHPHERVLAYSPSKGTAELLDTLAAYYRRAGLSVDPEQIQVTTGGSEAVLFTFMALCDPGDEVIVFEPFYTNYNAFATMTSTRLIPIATNAEDGFHLPEADIVKRYVTQRTRAVLLCSPNNPTGTVYTKEELAGIVRLVLEHNLFLVADEVYREFTFDGRNHVSIFNFPKLGSRAVVCDSLSKRLSACGARIGCIVSHRSDLIDAVLRFGQSRLCSPTLEQAGAAAALREGDELFHAECREYQRRRDVVFEALQQMPGVFCMKPEGAFYCVPRLPVDDAERFAIWMLTDFELGGETTMVAPAAGFYATPGKGKNEIRIAYVLREERLKKAMAILAQGLTAYPGRTTSL
jgi:aspartate aminotransferase